MVDGGGAPGPVWSFRTELGTDGLGFDEIVLVKRKPYSSDHNYSVVANGTSPDRFLAENGIYLHNLRNGETRAVVTAAELPGGTGVIRKLSLSFDARKMIFDYRRDRASGFRIWEANLDGTGLRQLTFRPADEDEKVARYGVASYHTDDMHPCYLPDGAIVFTSSRCEHGILCFTQPACVTVVLHRMDALGGHIEQLTQSPVSEFSPTDICQLSSGRGPHVHWLSRAFGANAADGGARDSCGRGTASEHSRAPAGRDRSASGDPLPFGHSTDLRRQVRLLSQQEES